MSVPGPTVEGPQRGWVWRMAWRDARSSARRLLLYVSTIIVGVAALVAIRAFAINLAGAIDTEAKVLLGADLELYGRQAFDDEAEALFAGIGGDQARQVSFGSMAYFPNSGNSRLVRVRAVSPGYPFYGELETRPAAAAGEFQDRRRALVDDTLMLQFGAEVGDPIRIGSATFEIGGRLDRIPGEVPTASLIGPRVFIPFASLAATELERPGSRMTYSVFFRLPDSPEAVVERVETLRPQLRRLRLEVETVQYRREVVADALDDLSRFLYLSGFAALLLGGIGVASSVHLYAKTKVRTVAVLRCLGAAPRTPVLVFVLQSVMMGVAGAVAGALLGVVVQSVVPRFLGGFLPVEVEFRIAPQAVLEGLATGLGVAFLFSALPLVTLRRVTPLLAVRMFVDPRASWHRDPVSLGLLATVVIAVTAVAVQRSGSAALGFGLVGGLGVGIAVLAGAALLLRWAARRLLPSSWAYPWRQGVANLYRPRNQTLVVMLSLGFGAFVLATLYLVQSALLQTVGEFGLRSNANLVMFDIQPDQLQPVREIVEGAGLPILMQTPVVQMRLAAVRSRDLADHGEEELNNWALRREYNSTYRAQLAETEELIEGEWVGETATTGANADDAIPISLEESIARRLEVGVGDTLRFDVHGVVLVTRVASIRRVDWEQVSPNFFVVFPSGVLETAPQQIVLVSRAESPEVSADVQRRVVRQFANISVMDLALILRTVDAVLDRVAMAVQFMALFSLVAGLTVLVVAVLGSRYERIRESVLLRTLGASRKQILQINAVEYLALGALAAATGLGLALVGAWALTRYVFETPMVIAAPALVSIFLGVTVLTLLIGLFGSRGVTTRPPLLVLRSSA